jgi:hypothetical protein
MQREGPNLDLGPDGIPRSHAEQKRINELLALAFKGEAGKAAMDYLRSISIERVGGPHISNDELRHLEGMRFIVGVISQRISAAHKENEDAARRSQPEPAGQPARRRSPLKPAF